MARCKECYGVIARTDSECYLCGLPVSGRNWWARRKKEAPSTAPVTPLSNLLFVVSVALTLFSILVPNKIPVSVGATLGGILFVVRIAADRFAQRQQRLALSPVTFARFHR
jgi:hypothetical protein